MPGRTDGIEECPSFPAESIGGGGGKFNIIAWSDRCGAAGQCVTRCRGPPLLMALGGRLSFARRIPVPTKKSGIAPKVVVKLRRVGQQLDRSPSKQTQRLRGGAFEALQ